ncbi:MAG TPA: hypothetical protein VLK88_08870 [Gemmatimonadales bacterium]|nr:hypothetical protein [Gemmatimonadales bacterium]
MKTIRKIALTVWTTAALACGGNDGSDGSGPNDQPTPQTDVPAALQGAWYHGEVSPSNFYDPTTGHWDGSYGDGLFYSLTADGHYSFGYRLYTSAYGCTNVVFFWKTGTVSVDPATQSFTVYPHEARMKSEDNCRSEWNYEKDIGKDPETIYWEFGKDDWGGDALLLKYANTDASAFYPWNMD